jgi:hypothetical protein
VRSFPRPLPHRRGASSLRASREHERMAHANSAATQRRALTPRDRAKHGGLNRLRGLLLKMA